MNCFCNDITLTKDFSCVICKNIHNKLMNQVERVWECHKIILMGCGILDFICENCKLSGWYSTAGFGGPTYHINKITGEKRYIPMIKGDPF